MVTQNWVSQAGKRRFSMSYCPEQTPHTTVGALLLPGFLEPMCDTDYFMSKLAKSYIILVYMCCKWICMGPGTVQASRRK